MEQKFDYGTIDEILKNHDYSETMIVTILQEVQAHFGYLPKEAFPYLAQELKVSEAMLYGVATFYENFSLEPKGKCVIRVCDGTACHVRHSTDVLKFLREELNLPEGRPTTDDGLFTVEIVSCLGACGLAPAMTVNGKVYPAMTKEKAAEIIKAIKEEEANA